MNQRLSLPTALLLTVPPLMWAGNAVVGRAVADLIPGLHKRAQLSDTVKQVTLIVLGIGSIWLNNYLVGV